MGIIANKYLKEGRPHKIPDVLSDYEKFVNFCFVLNFTREAGKKRQIFMPQAQGQGITIKQNDCQIAGIALTSGIGEIFTRG